MIAKLSAPAITVSIFAVALSWVLPAMGAGDIAFSNTPSFQSEKIFDLAVTEDKKAFTMTFSDLQLGEKGESLPTPVVTRVFSVVLPFSGGQNGVEIPFHIQGFAALATKGTSAYVVFSVNGQTSTVNLPTGLDESFLHTLVFKAASASEARLTILLVLERDTKYPEAAAFLNIEAIDTETKSARKAER